MAWNLTPLSHRLGITYPLIQAPMAGGFTSPELVGAVCNAGGLGSFAAALLSPAEIRSGVEQIRRDRKSTRLNSSHIQKSRMPSSA